MQSHVNVNAQAANMADQPKSSNDVDDKYKVPLVFMKESELFGDRRPGRQEWIQHVELYRAIGQKIDVSHITGLQRVRGMWRIYLDNIEDKVTLMSEGVPLRGKKIPVLNTNPDRLDGEATVRVRVKNIPLSVDDGLIKRAITLKGPEVISLFREKLRVDNKLTNCETGDRIFIVKASSLVEPLPNFMSFGKFMGRVIHPGQEKRETNRPIKCSKCLQDGHNFPNCPNDWVCTFCNESGHTRADCKTDPAIEPHTETSDSEVSDDETVTEKPNATVNQTSDKSGLCDQSTADSSKPTRRTVRASDRNRQQSIDRYVTPTKGLQVNVPERSPPTPAEELHDKNVSSKKHKTHKQSNKSNK